MTNTELQSFWTALIHKVKEDSGDGTLHQLLRNSRPVNVQNNVLYIFVPNQLMKKMFISKLQQITPILQSLANEPLQLSVESLEAPEENEIIQPTLPQITPTELFDSHLDKKYSFDNFIIGNNTRLVFAAAKRVVETPGKIYNPLFIYGKPGLGKTHIIQAIGNKLLENNPQAKVLYITTEAFTNDLIYAIRHQTTDAFHDKYRELDCLIIDDIQQLKGKERTQEEFFNTFNSLESSYKQVIIASDRVPQEIETLQDRITSRLSKGFLGDIQQPDFETRLAILNLKLEQRNIILSDECKNIIAGAIKTDIRVLESVCNHLQILEEIGEPINPDITLRELKRFCGESATEQINFDKILNVVCTYYDISKDDILSKKRNAKINFPRQVIMYLTRKLTNLSLSQIGKELGGKDHSTIIHGFEKINSAIETKDEKITGVIHLLSDKLKS